MKLKSFNFLLGLLIILFSLPVKGEDKIDIWKNKKRKKIQTFLRQYSKKKKIKLKLINQKNLIQMKKF